MSAPTRKRQRITNAKIDIKLRPLSIRNSAPKEFMESCIQIPLLGYLVERVGDGSKVCVTKPGGKTFRDFQVWVVKPNGDAWRPSHGKIYKDLRTKCYENRN